MTSDLPPTIADAFGVAAGDLGMFSAARLFVRESLELGGPQLVSKLRERLGSLYPVLGVFADRTIAGHAPAPPRASDVLESTRGLERLLIVGVEADCLDELLVRLPPATRVGLIVDTSLTSEPARIMTNLEGRATRCEIDDFARFAGARSGLLTYIYGTDGFRAAVPALWHRVLGPDVRTIFRSIVGWNLLGERMEAYPRWLAETSVGDFSDLVGGGE